MADAEFGYISPPETGQGAANEYMDAEPTGRARNGIPVKLQRVVDRFTIAAVDDARDAIVTALNGATDEEVAAVITAFRTAFQTRDLATGAQQDAMLLELQRKPNSGDAQMARPTLETRQRQGLAFMSSTGRLNITTTGHFRATVRNPPTSTRTVYLQRLALFCSAGPAYAHVYINPTLNLPVGTNRPVNNSRVGNPTQSLVEVVADTSAVAPLGGGADTGIDLALPAGARTVIELSPLSIPPGVTMGLNIPFAGAADVVMTGYWYEES